MSPPVRIRQLKDLETLENDAFCDAFNEHLGLIFQYARNDILGAIDMRDLDTLLKLRNSLCTSAKVAFPAYMSATMVQRKG